MYYPITVFFCHCNSESSIGSNIMNILASFLKIYLQKYSMDSDPILNFSITGPLFFLNSIFTKIFEKGQN